ncbi:transposase [Streptomyces sp. Rer75]|nr:transposase [Streptomyces sp. Rer75]
MLHTPCRWRDLPPQLGYGSGHTAWRRLRAWHAAGVGTACPASYSTSSPRPS